MPIRLSTPLLPPLPALPRRLRPRALGAWLALAFTLLSIVLTLLLVGVIERKATEQVKSSIGNGLAELALQTSDKLERGMFERYREVGLLAQRLSARTDLAPGQRRATLEQLQSGFGFYSWIGVAGLDGRVEVAAHGLLEGVDVSGRPWFGRALRGQHVGDVHDAMLLAGKLPRQAEPWRFVDIAFPLLDGAGRPGSVLGVHMSWEWARDIERSVMAGLGGGAGAEALIVDSHGDVLLGPADVAGKRLTLASLDAARRQQDGGYLVERWPDGATYLVGFARGRGHAGYPGLGWTVLVRQDIDEAYAPARRLRNDGLAAGVLLAALFSLAGVVVARRITRPLHALAGAAQRIRAGETAAIAPQRASYEEVDALSATLETLLADQVQRRRELEELNATLERRVTERTHELERALATVRAGKQRLRSVVETAQEAYVGVDMEGRVVEWNSAAQQLLGWTRDEIVGRPVGLVIPERFRDSERRARLRFIDTGAMSLLDGRVERVLLTRAGAEVPVEVSTGLAGTGEGLFFSVFLHDISARKRVERMKEEFIATVSHELRTPLTSISASLALLADGMAGELPSGARGLVDVADASSKRLVRLVSDVLDLQKIEAGQMDVRREVQPLLPVTQGALETMAGFAGQAAVTLVCHAEPGAERLRAAIDRDRITQVLTNLVSNAVKFSRRGGTVTLALEGHDGWVRIAVSDQGAGIPEHFRARVFHRFAQADGADSRRQGGTGLGLSICKSIVEEHGGRIRFDSVHGQGTTFYVELPAAEVSTGTQG
ncbi:ATP-binding protein [Massilia sp. 9096]|uniref:sensor histidine kinase n=1 Tax=Massilia sp. 9096 TaxID=1500894 RepID=UPI00068ADBE4|nr:ATP-binding protein [Massilia sp. 9096]